MQVSGLKTELDRLQRDAEIKPLRILLKHPPSDITDTQLTNLLLTVNINQLPASVLREVSTRIKESNGRFLLGIPTDHLIRIIESLRKMSPSAGK